MNTRAFIEDPWGKGSLHGDYESSFLHMRPAPEYASGEVLLASTYRYVGFPKLGEGNVPSMGREFQKLLDKDMRPTRGGDGNGLDPGLWKQIVTGSLRSPKLPNQAAKRFLQVSPVVPDAALYSLSARLTQNSWNPGSLVARVIQFGVGDGHAANELWGQLFDKLSVGDDDDVWARFLQGEFECWRPANGKAQWERPGPFEEEKGVSLAAVKWRASGTSIPANRFAHDFQRVLALKNQLTRRQWISFVEAILRLGTASDVLWVCHVNHQCFCLALEALQGAQPPTLKDLQGRFGVKGGFWRYGQPAASVLTSHTTDYIKARARINLLLYMLEEQFGNACPKDCLANLGSIQRWVEWLGSVRDGFDTEGFWSRYQDVVESDPRLVAGKKGISANIKEFLRHVLGQRQTNEPGLDSYDQGYCLVKKAAYDKAPWVVGLGPVSVLALVHACANASCGPTTVDVFCRHLGEYGIEIETQDIPGSSLGRTLRNLGLVLDSPDAEGGMVLVNPFEMMDHGVGGE